MSTRACSSILLRLRPSLNSSHGNLRLSSVARANGASLGVRVAMRSRRSFTASTTVQVKKYTTDHEWIELDSDGTTGTIGISTYAANALGDVVYVELPQPDIEFNAGDTIGAVESVKSASDILTPVTGTIIEANGTLEDKPGSINKNPEGDAWIAKIKVKDTRELDDLMDKEAYGKFTEE